MLARKRRFGRERLANCQIIARDCSFGLLCLRAGRLIVYNRESRTPPELSSNRQSFSRASDRPLPSWVLGCMQAAEAPHPPGNRVAQPITRWVSRPCRVSDNNINDPFSRLLEPVTCESLIRAPGRDSLYANGTRPLLLLHHMLSWHTPHPLPA